MSTAPKKQVEHLEDFTAHEWCNALLSDPTVTHIGKRHPSDLRNGPVSSSILTVTMFTDEAIRAFLFLYKRGEGHRRHAGEEALTGHINSTNDPRSASAEARRQKAKVEKIFAEDDPDTPESIILASIGRELDGGVGRAHGGLTAMLLDQVMGSLVSQTFEFLSATLELNVKYKNPIMTPCVLLCRAKFVREKGRWLETKSWIEDGHGKVYAEGSGTFVINKVEEPKL